MGHCAKQRGDKNSSKTRVQPFFSRVTGLWLERLLGEVAGTTQNPVARRLHRLACTDASLPRCEFERKLTAPQAFLEWLVCNPDRLQWPGKRGKRKQYGAETQANRSALVDGTPIQRKEAQAEALARLREGLCQERRWWVFEGRTHVDFCVETAGFILLVEGKRTDKLSERTDWFPRNQLVRNLECAHSAARKAGKDFGVLLLVEREPRELTLDVVAQSLPHFSEPERQALMQHYLGFLTWGQACKTVGIDASELPQSVSRCLDVGS